MKIKIRSSKLSGEIRISGSKNSTLPLMSASIVIGGKVTLKGVPNIKDINVMCEVLDALGVHVAKDGDVLSVDATWAKPGVVKPELISAMRGSVLILGACLSRFGQVVLPPTGGCAIGKRPIDQHIKAATSLGAQVLDNGDVMKANGTLKGGKIKFDKITVTGTENAILMAVCASGETVIENAACEPEVVELINFLRKVGAKIEMDGRKIQVERGHLASNIEWKVMPDRIEAGTFMIAAACTRGKVKVERIIPEHIKPVVEKLRETGAEVEVGDSWVDVKSQNIRCVELVAEPFPGFPTDMQAPFTVLMCTGKGESRIEDKVFPERFLYTKELKKMNAKIRRTVKGILVRESHLKGAKIKATDLRATAALLIAGLCAEGETVVENAEHILRGYENPVGKFKSLRGDISWAE